MTLAQQNAIDSYRKRQSRRGLKRLEVQAPEADVPLLRRLARALREDSRESSEIRQALHRALAREAPEGTLKQLLEAAPLEGVDISRPRDLGRKVEL